MNDNKKKNDKISKENKLKNINSKTWKEESTTLSDSSLSRYDKLIKKVLSNEPSLK